MEVRVEHVSKSYDGVAVLRDVSFSASCGVTCVMAPSGTGKTTLLRILLGLEQPDKGSVTRCRWSAVFQEDRLLEHLNAMENLRFVLGNALDEAAARALLERLHLADTGEKKVRDFSGGMKRRLALSRALLSPSDALALDEPFTGLDEENRRRCLDCIQEAAREKPVLLVTHDPADAEALGATVIRL